MAKAIATLVPLFFIGSISGSAVELTDSNFQSTLDNHPWSLVMFYAPWCGHCKKLKPEFDKAAKDLVANDIFLAKVDCTEGGKEKCNSFQVSGYPTLKIFKDGELHSDYSGPRSASGIVSHMLTKTGPPSKEFDSHEDLKKYLDACKETVIVSYSEDKDKQVFFSKMASKMNEEIKFAHINKKTGDYSGFVLHRPPHLHSKIESPVSEYAEDTHEVAFEDWVKSVYHGLAGHRTIDSLQSKFFRFDEPLVVALYDVDYVKNVKGTNYWRNRVMKVAKSFADKVKFAVSNIHDFTHEIEEFGLRDAMADTKTPKVVAKNEGKKYVMKDDFSVENLEKFVSDLMDGKLEPYLKSEEIPDNSENDVKVVVAKNFQEMISDEKEKDILLEFYAPWCGHCKKLAPVYEEVAAAMKGENVLIAKMDATANDVPSNFHVTGFPTIFYIKAGGEPKLYDGGRDKENFIEYLAKHSTSELKQYNRDGSKKKKTEL